MIRAFSCAGALALFGASISSSIATTIGFDDLSGGTVVTNQYQNLGVIFSGHVQVVGPGVFTNPVSGPNSMAFFDPINAQNGYTITAAFVIPGTNTPGTTDFVAFTPTDASNFGTIFELVAFNASDVIIGSASKNVSSSGVYNPADDTEVSISVAGIAYVRLSVSNPGDVNKVIEGDDFRFNEPVPAPGALALVTIAGVAAATRSRRARG